METKKFKTLFALKSTQVHVGHNFTGNGKEDVLSILNIFKDWVLNPEARGLIIESSNGIENHFSLSSGICGNLAFICCDVNKTILGTTNIDYLIMLRKIFVLWPKFSGCVDYPVPSTETCRSSKNDDVDYNPHREVYRVMSEGRVYSMYDSNDGYGKLRLELLDFIIQKVEEDFENYVVKC